MKQHINRTKVQRDVLTPRKTSSKKKIDKPWQLEYMWTDKEAFTKSLFNTKGKFGVWIAQWPGRMGCFIDVEHMVKQVEKTIRSGNTSFNNYFYGGRSWRLVHTQTKQVINVEINLHIKTVITNEED